MSWPSQKAQPVGGKLKPTMRTSATKGLDMEASSVRLRILAEQRDDVIEDEVGLHVVVRLASAGDRDGARIEILGAGAGPVEQHRQIGRQRVTGRGGLRALILRHHHAM